MQAAGPMGWMALLLAILVLGLLPAAWLLHAQVARAVGARPAFGAALWTVLFGAVLLTAGKAGQFELNDMARFFPLLTAQAKGLGLVGQEAVSSLAAMLQIARTGAGTSSEAANNLANFLQKITSEETVKNFKKAGIDIEQVLRDCFITVEPDA